MSYEKHIAGYFGAEGAAMAVMLPEPHLSTDEKQLQQNSELAGGVNRRASRGAASCARQESCFETARSLLPTTGSIRSAP